MIPGQERKRMEERFGEIGEGLMELTIEGKRLDLYQLLAEREEADRDRRQ